MKSARDKAMLLGAILFDGNATIILAAALLVSIQAVRVLMIVFGCINLALGLFYLVQAVKAAMNTLSAPGENNR